MKDKECFFAMVFVVLLFMPAAVLLYFMSEIAMNVFNFDLMAKLYEYTDTIEIWLEDNYDIIMQTENFLMEAREYVVEFIEKF
ncbi:MAG: hypothetical protein IJ395_08905 [Clostridia bacterium]|nr:hypothetical protein [Clostridia bacterium]